MRNKWPIVIIMLGSLTIAVAHAAQSDKSQIPDRQAKPNVIPSDTMHQIFQNLYHEPLPLKEQPVEASFKEYRDQLRAMLAMNFTNNLQVGLDNVKAKPSEKSEIIVLEPHLAPKGGQNENARGYGVQVRLKLD